MKRVFLLVVMGFGASLLMTTPLFAQSSETIQSFNVDITVDQTGSATVIETIDYDFTDNQRRGIFRDIPQRSYVTSTTGYERTLSVTSVTRDRQNEPFALTDNGEFMNIRIGDPDITITGLHTYVITYDISPLPVTADDATEIIRYDAPGTGWEVPVLEARIAFSGPAGRTSLTCYEGSLGSTDQTCEKVGQSNFAASTPLAAGQTITGEYVFPAGTFSNLAQLVELPSTDTPIWQPIAIGSGVAASFSYFVLKPGIAALAYRRRRRQELVKALYEPPKDMSPAEIGLLIDNSSGGAELTAALISLAVNGHMKITQSKPKRLLSKAEYTFTKTQSPKATASTQEKAIYTALFNGQNSISSKDVAKSVEFSKKVRTFHKALEKKLKARGFYKPVSFLALDKASRMTDEGYAKWAEIAGFKEFLTVTQKDRLAFHDAPEKKPEHFSEYLAYAAAMGVEKEWIKQFKGLAVDVSDWYDGPGNNLSRTAGITALTSDLGSMSRSASQSAGSSGAGGGFSGGGSGGGGGGSW